MRDTRTYTRTIVRNRHCHVALRALARAKKKGAHATRASEKRGLSSRFVTSIDRRLSDSAADVIY